MASQSTPARFSSYACSKDPTCTFRDLRRNSPSISANSWLCLSPQLVILVPN
jgi:hypothetical protein